MEVEYEEEHDFYVDPLEKSRGSNVSMTPILEGHMEPGPSHGHVAIRRSARWHGRGGKPMQINY